MQGTTPGGKSRNHRSDFRRFPLLACLAGLVCSAFLAGCAKTAEPHPPELQVPIPPADPSVRQYGDQALLSVSMPVENTNGSPVSTLGRVEVLRAIEDPAGPPPAGNEEFLRHAETLFLIPGDRLAPYLRGDRLVLRDSLDFPDRSVIYSRRFRYAFVFVNQKGQSAGPTATAALAPVPIPYPPGRLFSEVIQDRIRIRWDVPSRNMDGSGPPRIAGYDLFRAEDPAGMPAVPLNAKPLMAPEFEDQAFRFDATYYYQVTVIGSLDPLAESVPSPVLKVETRDVFPPGAPRNFNAVAVDRTVVLLWVAPDETDVAGYRIYRREEGSAEPVRLQSELITGLSFRDAAVQSGKTYHYAVRAVDRHGNEGPPTQATVEVQ